MSQSQYRDCHFKHGMAIIGKRIVRNRYAKLASLKNHSVYFTTVLSATSFYKAYTMAFIEVMTMNPVVRVCSFVEEPPEMFQCGVY